MKVARQHRWQWHKVCAQSLERSVFCLVYAYGIVQSFYLSDYIAITT